MAASHRIWMALLGANGILLGHHVSMAQFPQAPMPGPPPIVRVTAMAFSPNGRYLVTGYSAPRKVAQAHQNPELITLWDVPTGQEVNSWSGHRYEITYLEFLPNEKQAVSTSRDGTIRLWDVMKGKEIRTLYKEASWIHTATLTPDGNQLLFLGSEKPGEASIKLFDLSQGILNRSFQSLGARRAWLDASADNREVLASGYIEGDYQDVYWDLKSGKIARRFASHQQSGIVLFAHEPTTIVKSTWRGSFRDPDAYIALLDATTGMTMKKFTRVNGGITFASVAAKGKRMTTVGGIGLACWDLEKFVPIWSTPLDSQICAISPDGKWTATATGTDTITKADLEIQVWDSASGKLWKTMRYVPNPRPDEPKDNR